MKYPIIHQQLLLALLTSLTLTTQAQTIRYVSSTGTNTNPATATTWATSTTDLQGAINASAANDQVWVAAGVYKPGGNSNTNRTISFAMRNNLAIYGGFVGTETTLGQRTLTNPLATTLSGEIGNPASTTDNSYHVIYNVSGLTNTAILDGFVITAGNADGDFSSCPNCAGGGMLNEGNFNEQFCSPTVRNCAFVNNKATIGGAVCNSGYFSGNASPIFLNCQFMGNEASFAGGAMFNDGYAGTASPVLANCLFQNNRASGAGAIRTDSRAGGNSSPVLTNCTLLNNTATNGNSGLFDITTDGATTGPRLINCIVWNNGGTGSIASAVTSVTATYSLFEPSVTGYVAGPGNLTTTVSPFAGNSVQLALCSPAINAGDPATTSALVGTTDLAGNPRFFAGARIDMGAYEFQAASTTPSTRLFVRASATGANTGLSWTDAFTDLQSALTFPCSQSLTEVWVANGTYKPTSTTARTVSFAMLPNVAIYGGFTGTETTLSGRPAINLTAPSNTTLSGEIGNLSILTDNSFHVINNPPGLTNSAILDGFVITAGYATGAQPDDAGGGMLNRGNGTAQVCSPLVRNCLFATNTALLGGGVSNNGAQGGNSSPRFVNCIFQNGVGGSANAAHNLGDGGVSSPSFVQCLFQNNVSATTSSILNSASGGVSNPSFQSCTFRNNLPIRSTAPNSGTSAPQFTNCVITSGFTNVSAVGPTVQYSLLPASVTGYLSVPGNITATGSNFFASGSSPELAPNAPGINAGDPATTSATVGSTDLAGKPRFGLGGRIDMGTLEFQCQTASRFYVRATATGAGTGLSWTDAFTDLQAALSYPCSGSVSEIWVANGIYRPTSTTDRTVSFRMLPNVAIYGGFLGIETSLSQRPAINQTTPSRTILSGEIGSPTSTTDNSYNVIRNAPGLTSTAILDGFMIVSGNASNTSLPGSTGGGMYNDGQNGVCSPLVRNCTFQNNQAVTNGGAVYNNSFLGNASPQFVNCQWTGNSATSWGGAVFNSGQAGTSSPLFTNCLFESNRAVLGGVMAHVGNGSNGVCSATLTNCTLQGNSVTTGGSVFVSEGSNGATTNPLLSNCVVFGNVGNTAFALITNGSVQARYSLLETGISNYSNLVGNLTTTTSPFAGTATSRLAPGSPAINAGDPATTTATNGATDLGGYPRVFGGRVDMGAQESQCNPATPITRLYVRASATGANTGLNWADALPDLQSALNYPCQENVAEIWVANGLYKPTSGTARTVSFSMKPGIALYGGFLGTETALSQRPALNLTTPSGTTLSGEIGDPNSVTDNSANVLYNAPGLTASAILDGFVVTGGNANVLPVNDPWAGGGGLFNDAVLPGSVCTPTIRNVFFVNNLSNARGGGILSAGPSLSTTNTSTISNCVFTGNTAQSSGGGLSSQGVNLVLTNTLFTNNRSISSSGGGGVIFNGTATLSSCTFVGNAATTSDGGGFNAGTAPTTLTDCVFQSNTANYGGGMNLNRTTSLVRNSRFLGNSALTDGAGIDNYLGSSLTVVNSVFLGNQATRNGGAIINEVSSTAIVTNSSFAGNAAVTGGGIYIDRSANTLTNSLIWGNSSGVVSSALAPVQVPVYVNSVVQSLNLGAGVFNGSINPGFVSLPLVGLGTVGDLRLQACSPAIDAGDPATTSATVGTTDLAGQARFVGARVDMGAFEFGGTPTTNTPTRLYVRPSITANANQTGLSWADAFPNLQSALTYPCSQSLTEIWVANGLYKPTSTTARTVSFRMLNNVAIYGGFVGTETALSQRPAINLTTPSGTTLSGEIGDPNSTTDNSYHVISNPAGLTTTAILDGFVITGGNANGSFFNGVGGGMYNDGRNSGAFCNPLIRNCFFLANSASFGGAIYNDGRSAGRSSPILTNCSFQNNTAVSAGGVLYNDGRSAGRSSPVLTNCSFQNNTAGAGGALFNYGEAGSSQPLLINCSFLSNRAVLYGGAILGNGLSSGNASLTLVNCSFQDNTAQQGGALFNDGNVSPQLTNCVLWNNGGSNTFFYLNAPASATATFSLFEPSVTGYVSLTGNITTGTPAATTSPFADTATGQLAPCSPAINAGDPATTTATVGVADGAGNPRFFANGRIDMGAYEFQDSPSLRISPPNGSSFTVCAGQTIGLPAALSDFLISLNGAITNDIPLNTALFGPALSATAISGPIKFVGQLTDADQGCAAYPAGTFAGKVALIRRGGCDFSTKVKNAQDAGAIGVLIFNNVAGELGLGGTNATITIPSGGISKENGEAIVGALATGEVMAKSRLVSYSWAPGTGLSSTTGIAVNATLTQTTAYTVTASAPGVCSSQTVITVTVAPAPTITITASPGLTVSPGQSITLTASGGSGQPATSYTWSNGQTTNPLVIPSASPSTYTITGQLGICQSTTTVTVNPLICGSVIYVTPSGAGSQNGSSWANAVPGSGLQMAINTAATCGSQTAAVAVWVANGLYKPTDSPTNIPTDRTISFAMLPNVAIYGGFLGTETALSQRPGINLTTPSGTTLSGEIGNPNSTTDNSYHVISNPTGLTSTAVLDGFLITSGNANGAYPDNSGGGMLNISNSSPLIRNCLFINNSVSFYGGAVFNNGSDNSNLVFTNCSFESNNANFGGAIFHQIGNILLTNVSFSRNRATTGGGAIHYGGESPNTRSTLTNVSFANNIAGFGTDIRSFGSGASLTLTNGVVFSNGSGNSFAITGGSSLLVNYSLLDSSIPGSAYTSGPGNLTTSVSPFASTSGTQLATGSPAIDAGDPATTSATVGLTDLAGNPRFVGGRIDMGATEFQGILEVFTLKDGLWNDSSVWSVGRLPLASERVRLKHVVTIPTGHLALSGTLIYDLGSKLIYEVGGRLKLGN